MADHEKRDGGGRVRSITLDSENELNAWRECRVAFKSAARVVTAVIERVEAAPSEVEREEIRSYFRGYCSRLALGMLAIAYPGSKVRIEPP